VKQESNQVVSDSDRPSTETIRTKLRQVARRQWWLWSTGLLVAILLTLGIASFGFPGLPSQEMHSEFYQFNLGLAVRGLIGLILLFVLYVIYEQLQIRRIDVEVFNSLGIIQERAEKIFKSAGRDTLTDLYNREFGERRLEEEVSRARRQSRPLAVLRMDLGGIDKIDDQLGSASADCATKLFAQHLRRELRNSDVAVRLNGAEFLVVLPECKEGEAEIVLNRLNRMTLEFGKQQTDIIAGWADHVDGDKPQALVMRAESTLHVSKQHQDGAAQLTKISVSFGAKIEGRERLAKLTARERQVFELLIQGKSNKEVASSLNLSTRTAETYRKTIMSRLEVHSAAELVLFAVAEKIIDVE
jgi:diguanylate cyclase (GGDEF)-like protein